MGTPHLVWGPQLRDLILRQAPMRYLCGGVSFVPGCRPIRATAALATKNPWGPSALETPCGPSAWVLSYGFNDWVDLPSTSAQA